MLDPVLQGCVDCSPECKQKMSLRNSISSANKSWQNCLTSMKQFNDSCRKICRSTAPALPRDYKSMSFPTGSSYAGNWNAFGMSGKGTYSFPTRHGRDAKYEGEFKNGVFHGFGNLNYDNGAVLKCQWRSGRLLKRTLVFGDGLIYSEHDWKYCTYPDRRFTEELDNAIRPAGDSYITHEKPPREIPAGYYDTGDGFYNPLTGTIFSYDDLEVITRQLKDTEGEWVKKNCRFAPERSIGQCHFYYEKWEPIKLKLDDSPPPVVTTQITQKVAEEEHSSVLEDEQNEWTWQDWILSKEPQNIDTGNEVAPSLNTIIKRSLEVAGGE